MTVNSGCPEAKYPVLVTFGSKPEGADECNGQKNMTNESLYPGEPATFSVHIDSISKGDDEKYCYIVSRSEWQNFCFTPSFSSI